jgi:ankyrin repeat protein
MKNFNEFINESIRDKMIPKSEEDIKKSLDNMDLYNKIDKVVKYNLLHLYSLDEILDVIDKKLKNHVSLPYELYTAITTMWLRGDKETRNKLELRFPNEFDSFKKGIIKTNESIRDKMIPKSEEDIEKVIKDYSPNEILELGYKNKVWNLVKKAIDKGANVHLNGDSALRQACINGELEIVKFLIDNGAELHIYEDDCLVRACYSGNLELVKYLVDKGGDIHAGGIEKVLRAACSTGQPKIVKYLLEKGADQRHITSSQVTFGESRKEILDILNKYIKKVNEGIRDKMTPKSKENIALSFKKTFNLEDNYIEVKIPKIKIIEPRNRTQLNVLLEYSDKYNLDIKDYDSDNILICGHIVDVIYFLQFYLCYIGLNKKYSRTFYVDYILKNKI